MKIRNAISKINPKNLIVLALIIVAHAIALFSSPFFLGSDYSKKILIDDYCNKNANGAALVVKSNLNHNLITYSEISAFKEKYDSELNTEFGLSVSDSKLNNKAVTLVSATPCNKNVIYNNYRIYSNRWTYINYDNYLYIPKDMVSDFADDPDKIFDIQVNLVVKGVSYPFKIGGFYDTAVNNGGWRSRGKYFYNTFDNCIFVSESFLKDKFDCAFEMLTADTDESGVIYDKFSNLVSSHKSNITISKSSEENRLLTKLNTLSQTKKNKVIQVIIIVVASLALLALLFFSIRLFSVNNISSSKRWGALFIWGLIYYGLSLLYIFIVKNKVISLSGFTAYGANKAILNMILIFFIIFFVVAALRVFLSIRRDKMALANSGVDNNGQAKGDIIFVTKAKFPDENAFSTYIGGIASIYKNAGYNVICIGNGHSKRNEVCESYFGKYVSLRSGGDSIVSKLWNIMSYEKRVRTYLLDNYKHPVHIFFSCEFDTDFYEEAKRIYSDVKVSYSFIITEEYTKDEFENYNFLAKKSLRINHYFIEKYNNKNDSFILISKYLYQKFKDRDMKCIYIPFSFNNDYISSYLKKPIKHKGINYIYCGSPENKDLLPTMINAFSSLGELAYKHGVRFNVIGVDDAWANKHGVSSYDKSVVTFFGRQSRDFVYSKYLESDYSVLLRDENKTFAKAGFPTKISESMNFGVVPITNLSSNLGDYLDDDNSIIVKGHGVSDFKEAIEVSIRELKKLSYRKKMAVLTADIHFNIDTYEKELLSLLDKEQ